MQQTEEVELEDIDVVVSVSDVMSRMKDHRKHKYALEILDNIDASKKYPFAIVAIRNGRCAEVWFSSTSQSEEETIIQRDLEPGDDTAVDCVGLAWCKMHSKEALHAHALQICIDYIDSCAEKEWHGCNAQTSKANSEREAVNSITP